MIQKTIRRFGYILPLVVFAMLLIAATTTDSAARTHKTGRKGVISHSHGRHGRIAQNTRRHHGKYFARLSRHHSLPQRPLTTAEKEQMVQQIRTLATSATGSDESSVTTNYLATGDSVIAAEASSSDVQSQIAEAAKEEQAEDGIDASLDKYLKSRSATSASASTSDPLDPAGDIYNQQDFTLSSSDDPDHAAQRSDVMAEIINWIGTRYVFGGEDRGGIDCSAFTRQVFEKAFGLDLPRTAWMQSQLGTPVEKEELQFGDLVFFKTAGYAPITHVGIYIGEGLFANAACSRGVTVASLESEYWSKHYVAARRLFSNSGIASLNATPSTGAVAER